MEVVGAAGGDAVAGDSIPGDPVPGDAVPGAAASCAYFCSGSWQRLQYMLPSLFSVPQLGQNILSPSPQPFSRARLAWNGPVEQMLFQVPF
jgi:hypothetical protein